MADDTTLDAVVTRLSADLSPVRRLPPPSLRAAAWIGVALAMVADWGWVSLPFLR